MIELILNPPFIRRNLHLSLIDSGQQLKQLSHKMIRQRHQKSPVKCSTLTSSVPARPKSGSICGFRRRYRRKLLLLSTVISCILVTIAVSKRKSLLTIFGKNLNANICEKFDHGDISPFPNLTSVFNCNSPSGKCEWFYPAKFFNGTCGIGKKYSSMLTYMEEHRSNRTLWANGPPIVLPWAMLHPGIRPNGKPPGRTLPLPRHNLSMVHVHKTGGTSLVVAFGELAGRSKGRRFTSYQPPRIPMGDRAKQGRIPERVAERMSAMRSRFSSGRNMTGKHLDGAVKYRKTWREKEHTVFAVVRDPAERFISAIGQATGAFGSSNNGVSKKLSRECVKKTGRETLRCFVDLMITNGTWIEVHFTPMALEISFATMFKDIPVAVFPFDAIPTLMYELNSSPKFKKKDGKAKGYRKSQVLTNLTVDDYDDGTLRDLCNVYAMDVLLLSRLDYATNCDPYLDEIH